MHYAYGRGTLYELAGKMKDEPESEVREHIVNILAKPSRREALGVAAVLQRHDPDHPYAKLAATSNWDVYQMEIELTEEELGAPRSPASLAEVLVLAFTYLKRRIRLYASIPSYPSMVYLAAIYGDDTCDEEPPVDMLRAADGTFGSIVPYEHAMDVWGDGPIKLVESRIKEAGVLEGPGGTTRAVFFELADGLMPPLGLLGDPAPPLPASAPNGAATVGRTKPDGHCLFSSISAAIHHGDATKFDRVRQAVGQYFINNKLPSHVREDIKHAMEADIAAGTSHMPARVVQAVKSKNWGEYGRYMRLETVIPENTPAWGGGAEIWAASRVYKRTVRLYYRHELNPAVLWLLDEVVPEEVKHPPINLVFNLRDHYDVVLTRHDKASPDITLERGWVPEKSEIQRGFKKAAEARREAEAMRVAADALRSVFQEVEAAERKNAVPEKGAQDPADAAD